MTKPAGPLCNLDCHYRFFRHSAPAMQRMADLYRSGQPPAAIMEDLSSGPRRKPERS